MNKVIFSFVIIFFGLIIGQVIKYFAYKKDEQERLKIINIIATTRKITFFIFNPIILINSYWLIDFSNVSILMLPLICILVLPLSGVIGLLFSKLYKHTKEENAAMFSCSTFSNSGTIGGLIVFSFLGEAAFIIAAMYIAFESFYNYIIAYPVVKAIGEGRSNFIGRFKEMIKDHSIVVYVSTIFIGIILNFSPLQRPSIMSLYNEIMIPTVSFSLTFTIAFTMNFGRVKSYMKEGITVIVIKFLIAPIIAVTIGMIFNLHNIENALIMKVIIVMNLIPSGFNSILVPTIYKVDKDLANSAWIYSMIAFFIVIPFEYILLSFIG